MKLVYAALAAILLSTPALADSQGSATGGTAGTQSTGAGCINQAPTLSSGQQATLSCDASGNLKINGTLTPSGTQIVAPTKVLGSDISGTVTAGGVYQTVAAVSVTRNNCTIQNPTTATEVLNVKFGTMSAPFTLSPGMSIMSTNGVVSDVDAITLTAATTSHAFSGYCQ